MSQIKRYYCYFSAILIPFTVYRIFEIDVFYMTAFILPFIVSMLFHHPKIYEYSEYRISKFSFISLLFFLKNKMHRDGDSLFIKFLNRHSVSLLLLFLILLPLSTRGLVLVNYVIGMIFLELILNYYQRRNQLGQ